MLPSTLLYTFETQDIAVFLTLLVLEGVLAFDNAAVLAAMVRKLPVEQRRKALLYGLIGAYTFRVLAILAVVWIIRYPVLKLVGGLYLLYLASKHLFFRRAHGEHAEFTLFKRLGLTGFWGVVISIELADLAFALDQVLVAVALTDKIELIIAASLVAILFLRLSAVFIARLMDWFPQLEQLAYVAVGFVGLKLVVVDLAHRLGYAEFDIPKEVSVAVTLTLLVVPVLGKVFIDWIRRRRAPSP